MFEQALRIAAGESPDEHRRRIGELWAQFSAVAAANPYAWSREALAAEQIWQPEPSNRMVSWPYTKLMNSNNMVDQGAALVLTSAEKATYLQIPRTAGFSRTRAPTPTTRTRSPSGPSSTVAGDPDRRAAGAGTGRRRHRRHRPDRRLLVLPVGGAGGRQRTRPADRRSGRPLTVTGGLTFAGGPWNNYVTHSIATMAELLIADPGQRGLITANGGYLTKHSFGVYGTEPPDARIPLGGRASRGRPRADPHRGGRMAGVGTVESWTTPFNRTGRRRRRFSPCARPTMRARSR